MMIHSYITYAKCAFDNGCYSASWLWLILYEAEERDKLKLRVKL